jgi:hypothetical protein
MAKRQPKSTKAGRKIIAALNELAESLARDAAMDARSMGQPLADARRPKARRKSRRVRFSGRVSPLVRIERRDAKTQR